MINYSDKKNLKKMIELEALSLSSNLDIQKNLNRQILTFMKNYIGNINVDIDLDADNKGYYYINESSKILNKSNNNIALIKKLIAKLEKISSTKGKSGSELEEKIDTYNSNFTDSINTIFKNTTAIEKFIHEISLINMQDLLASISNTTDAEETVSNDFAIDSKLLDNSFIENTLIISEIQGKVFLPYKLEKVKELFLDKSNKYFSIQEVISHVYTKPIKIYKNAAISRFREAYKLIIEKEHGTKFKALTLASELFANYNLHPAIITACDSLDELDVYLACLDDNTLEEFPYFDIKYEIAPVVSKNEKKIEIFE